MGKQCQTKSCDQFGNSVIGICKYCTKIHCLKHRLPESHNCENQKDCNEESRLKNSQKILNNKIKTFINHEHNGQCF